jgi:hypothetical protein
LNSVFQVKNESLNVKYPGYSLNTHKTESKKLPNEQLSHLTYTDADDKYKHHHQHQYQHQHQRRNASNVSDFENNELIDNINHGDFDFIKKHINFNYLDKSNKSDKYLFPFEENIHINHNIREPHKKFYQSNYSKHFNSVYGTFIESIKTIDRFVRKNSRTSHHDHLSVDPHTHHFIKSNHTQHNSHNHTHPKPSTNNEHFFESETETETDYDSNPKSKTKSKSKTKFLNTHRNKTTNIRVKSEKEYSNHKLKRSNHNSNSLAPEYYVPDLPQYQPSSIEYGRHYWDK